MTAYTKMQGMRTKSFRRSLWYIAAFIAVLASGYYLLQANGLLELVTNTQQLRGWAAEQGRSGPLLIILMMAIAIIVNPIPSAPIALAAGAAYGHTWGTVYVVSGATAGALGAFWIARLLGYDLLSRVFGERLKLGWLGSQNALTGMVLVSRLIPFVSFDLVSYGAGLTPIKTWRFTFATLLGLVPASFLLTHFGGELTTSNLDQTMTVLLLVGVLTLTPLLIKAISRWYRRRKKNVNNTQPTR